MDQPISGLYFQCYDIDLYRIDKSKDICKDLNILKTHSNINLTHFIKVDFPEDDLNIMNAILAYKLQPFNLYSNIYKISINQINSILESLNFYNKPNLVILINIKLSNRLLLNSEPLNEHLNKTEPLNKHLFKFPKAPNPYNYYFTKLINFLKINNGIYIYDFYKKFPLNKILTKQILSDMERYHIITLKSIKFSKYSYSDPYIYVNEITKSFPEHSVDPTTHKEENFSIGDNDNSYSPQSFNLFS